PPAAERAPGPVLRLQHALSRRPRTLAAAGRRPAATSGPTDTHPGGPLMSSRLSYSLFMLLALGVFLLARRLQPRPPSVVVLPRRQRVVLGLAAFIGGSLGAKFGYFLANVNARSLDLGWMADGKTVVTGLAFAYLAVEMTK